MTYLSIVEILFVKSSDRILRPLSSPTCAVISIEIVFFRGWKRLFFFRELVDWDVMLRYEGRLFQTSSPPVSERLLLQIYFVWILAQIALYAWPIRRTNFGYMEVYKKCTAVKNRVEFTSLGLAHVDRHEPAACSGKDWLPRKVSFLLALFQWTRGLVSDVAC